MTIAKGTIRAALSLALVLGVTSEFALGSLAASSPAAASRHAAFVDDSPAVLAGKLTGTGQLTIDGEVARSGATVASGSRVATGADGAAVIDLGALGRIALRPNTTITLTFSAGAVSVMLDGAGAIDGSLEAGVTGKLRTSGARLHMREGAANLNSASGVRFLRAGEAAGMTADAEAVIAGSATFTAESGATERAAGEAQSDSTSTAPARGGVATAGIGGIIAMAAVATGVAVGIRSGGSSGSSTPTVRPSTITP